MKTRTLLIAAVMLVTLSAAAFGQSVFTTSSSALSTGIATGNAELVGTVVLTATSLPVTGDVYITYGGLPITNTYGVGTVITITCPNLSLLPTIDTTNSSYASGILAINIPALEAFVGGATSYSISVSGVRVAINGSGLTGALSATVTTQGGASPNTIAVGNGTVPVINSTTGAGIAASGVYNVPSTAATTGLASTVATGNPVMNAVTGQMSVTTSGGTTSGLTTAYSTITVKEGWNDAFTWFDNTHSTAVRITLAAVPPTGVNYVFPVSVTSYDNTGAVLNANWKISSSCTAPAVGPAITITHSTTAANLAVCYFLQTADSAPSAIDYLQIPVAINTTPSSMTFPVAAATYTYTATMGPVLGALTSGSPSSAWFPRFAALEVGPANILSVTPGQTNLLMPYVSTQAGYNTGIAIANTTADPGSAALGITGATAQTGPITFYFYPVGGSVISLATSALTSPTTWGLNSAGSLAPGQTFVGMLNSLLQAAGQTVAASNAFSGYAIVVTSFTDATGIYTVSNWTNITAYSAVMQAITSR